MRVSTLMLANHVEVRDSVLFIAGGSPEWLWVPEVPTDIGLRVALVLEEETDADRSGRFVAEALNPEGACGGLEATFEFPDRDDFVAGAPLLRPFSLGLPCNVTQVGAHQVRVRVENSAGATTEASARFGIRLAS